MNVVNNYSLCVFLSMTTAYITSLYMNCVVERARLEVQQRTVCEGDPITYQFVLDGGSCESTIPFEIYLEADNENQFAQST